MRATGLMLLAWMAPAVALASPGSYVFGGFSPGGREYWKHGPDERVCAPVGSSGSQPACRKVEKKDVRSFSKPSRARAMPVRVEDGKIVLGRARAFDPGERVTSVNANLFVSGDLVAVEYEATGDDGKHQDVVVFDQAAAPEPAPEPPAAAAPTAPSGNAYTRLLSRGGVWEQRQVPCDQAGVTLTLRRSRAFAIRIATRCQGQKDTTDLSGSWNSEGNDTLVLSFENEDAPMETLVCHLATCDDVAEDCLSCGDQDISFTMKVVRR